MNASQFVQAYNRCHPADRVQVIECSGATVGLESEGDCTVLNFADGSLAVAHEWAEVLPDAFVKAMSVFKSQCPHELSALDRQIDAQLMRGELEQEETANVSRR